MKPAPISILPEKGSCCSEAPASSCCTPAPTPSCCAPTPVATDSAKFPWVVGSVTTKAGPIPVVATELKTADILGAWKVRWSFGRNSYTIPPGLYAIGAPDENAPVLVTANYKLTFDTVRKELAGISSWILVLDTKGINVWCAAGKGTFGTDELVQRIQAVSLGSVVSHRTVILPQLGAPGVSAHLAARRSGFSIVYGPVRAEDLKAFLKSGMTATPEMRRVRFTFTDRLVLTPVELVPAAKAAVFAFGILFILNSIGLTEFDRTDLLAVLGAVAAGAVLTPALLPWIPGRMFSIKGALLGLLWAGILVNASAPGILGAVAYFLLLPAIAAFLAMNFTGASTYTSFSGVKKEMSQTVPPILTAGILGTILLLIDAVLRLNA